MLQPFHIAHAVEEVLRSWECSCPQKRTQRVDNNPKIIKKIQHPDSCSLIGVHTI